MALQEISFRLQHDSPYNNISRKYPAIPISVWCNHDKDILEIECNDATLFDRLHDDLVNLSFVIGTPLIRKTFEHKNVHVVVKHCSCYYQGSIMQALSHYNLLCIPPVSHREGWEYYRIVGFNAKDIKDLFRDLKRRALFEILSNKIITQQSVSYYFTISLGSFFASLTGKQMEAFLMALDFGYYKVPKRTTLDQIANLNRIPRSTYENHVRKAESKIMQAVGPYIRMRHSYPRRPVS